MKNFKYKTTFTSKANFKSYTDYEDKGMVSLASLDDLKSLMPDEEVRLENPDLLYSSFNAAVVNLINANDDGIMTDTGLRIARLFKDKHMNIEHNRFSVVGHIINYGFSKFGDNSILDESNIKGNDPFNICLASVTYRAVDSYFCEYLEDEGEEEISASWELGFDEFVIALGSKNLREAEIVSDEKQVKELSKCLRAYKGSGFTNDGVEVYRVVTGNPIPLGCAYTFSPAAAVKGIAVASELKSTEQKPVVVNINFENFEPKEKKQDNKIKASVNKNMKITSLEDIQQDTLAEMQASSIREFIRTKLDEASESYNQKVAEVEAEKKASEDLKLQVEASQKEAQEKLSKLEQESLKLKQELDEIKAERESLAKQNAFSERMSALDEEYDLSEADRKVIQSQIVDLTEESYASWKQNFDVLVSAKKKVVKTEEEKAEELKAQLEESKASQTIPNSSKLEKDEFSKFSNAFKVGEGVTIKRN